MSSFTYQYERAIDFAEGNYRQITMTLIPAEDILSTAITGYGCKSEMEFVVFGKRRLGFNLRGDASEIFDSYVGDYDTLTWWLENN